MHTRSAGGIVVNDKTELALVMSSKSQAWLFPKGRVEDGEDDLAAARREIKEETGLDNLELMSDLGEFSRERLPFERHGSGVKTIKMFLFRTPADAKLVPAMEIAEARWIPFAETLDWLGSPRTAEFSADRSWFSSKQSLIEKALDGQRRIFG